MSGCPADSAPKHPSTSMTIWQPTRGPHQMTSYDRSA